MQAFLIASHRFEAKYHQPWPLIKETLPFVYSLIACILIFVVSATMLLSSLPLTILAATATAFSTSLARSANYLNYTTFSGYFLQDDPATNATSFNFMTTNFGLINQTYSTDRNRDSRHSRTQWQRFAAQVAQLNRDAARDVEYKVLFMGRHGDGFHNDAQAYSGTPAWNCYYSVLDGNATVTWSDAHLSPLGVTQAKAVNSFWASEITNQRIPTPQTFYTSPLTRCLQTAQYTFDGLDLPRRRPFIPEVKELLREGISGHTCDRRNSSTYIHQNFPTYRIEPGFTESDELWEALHGETSIDQQIRSKKVLDEIFLSDDSTYISITSHSGEIGAILEGKPSSFMAFERPVAKLTFKSI